MLVTNAIVSSLFLAAIALFTAGTPHAVVLAVLLVGGQPAVDGPVPVRQAGLRVAGDPLQLLLQAQQELAETELTGTAGGDLVEATVKGTGELVGLVIKPEAVDPEDTETLADLVLAAVRDANNKVQAVTAAKLGPLAGGLGGGALPF